VIVKSGQNVELETAKTYIVRKPNSLKTIAQILGVSYQDLLKWNGDKKGVISAGNTIRVYEDSDAERSVKLLVDEKSLELFSARN